MVKVGGSAGARAIVVDGEVDQLQPRQLRGKRSTHLIPLEVQVVDIRELRQLGGDEAMEALVLQIKLEALELI